MEKIILTLESLDPQVRKVEKVLFLRLDKTEILSMITGKGFLLSLSEIDMSEIGHIGIATAQNKTELEHAINGLMNKFEEGL